MLTHKQREYVEAARAMGQRPMGVLAKQILPNIMAPIAVQITLDFARAIGVEAALSYLGLGLAAPYISWGLMVREAQDFLEVAPWLAVFPGIALAGVILAFTLVGDSLPGPHGPAHAPGVEPARTVAGCTVWVFSESGAD